MKTIELQPYETIIRKDQFFRNGRWLNACVSIGDLVCNWPYKFRRKITP